MDERTRSVRTVTVKELWDIFLQRLWIIILTAVVVFGTIFAIYKLTYVPKYESVSTLYIMREEDDATAAEKIQEYNLALWGMYDYDYMLKSQKTLNSVCEELEKEGIIISYGALRSSISINNPENTRMLEVRIVSNDPETAKRTVDVLCEIGIDIIAEVMDSEDQITIFEEGNLNYAPCNRQSPWTFVLIGAICAIVVYLIFVAMYLFDDRIKSEEDITEYLSLSVLGDIPDINASSEKHHIYGNKKKQYRYSEEPQTDRVKKGGRKQ